MENKKPKEEVKPLSLAEEARGILDEIKKQKEELKAENDRRDKQTAEALLSGTSGGHIDAPVVAPEDAKVNGAKEFFKGTHLEGAIVKANEKK